jgi:hypothetical protein
MIDFRTADIDVFGAELDPGNEPVGRTWHDVMREEQVSLWTDLAEAQQRTIGGVWSIACIGLAARIVRLARLVGPTPWREVQIPTLLNGMYERVLTDAGIQFEQPDWAHIAEISQRAERSWAGEAARRLEEVTKP